MVSEGRLQPVAFLLWQTLVRLLLPVGDPDGGLYSIVLRLYTGLGVKSIFTLRANQ